MSDGLRYIFVADDFTGASDTLATLTLAGQRARLFLDVPSPDDVTGLDAFGIATDARALGNDETTTLMARLGALLAAHRPEFLHYKVCSTFDSTPDTGNFVTATDQLCETLGIARRAMIGGQPSLGRYCIFGNLFARASDGKIHRIDRHPVMKRHPITPMTESDLRVHYANLGGGAMQLSDRLDPELAEKNIVTLFDAVEDADIARIGNCLRQSAKPLVCIGASGVPQAVFGEPHMNTPSNAQKFAGPVLAFVGSRSSVSREQIERTGAYSKISVDPEALDSVDMRQRAIALLGEKNNVLIHIKEGNVNARDAREIALASARLIKDILLRVQVEVLSVAGGDTSSAVIKALSPEFLSCNGDFVSGVPLCLAHFASAPTLPVVLKGGQVGRPDFFDHISQGLVRI